MKSLIFHTFKTRTSSLLACYQQCSAWEVTVRWPWCGGPLAIDTVRTFVVFSRPSLSHSERLSGDSDLQPPSPLNPHFPAHTCCFPGNRAGAPLVWPGRLPWQPALPIRISLKNNNRLATQSLHISRANPMSDRLNNWTKWEPMSPTYMCTAGIFFYLSINYSLTWQRDSQRFYLGGILRTTYIWLISWSIFWEQTLFSKIRCLVLDCI